VYYLGVKWIDGILVVGIGLVAVGVGLNLKEKVSSPKVELVKNQATPTAVQSGGQAAAYVVVDMEGEVLKPGVYKLAKGSRVSEAMAVCGGLSVNSDRDWVEKNINRAKIVSDGEKIYIPKKNEVVKVLGTTKTSNGLININTAGVEELDKLTGIGPAIAGRIIDYRDKNGGFKDVNEIKLVSGVGEKLFEKIKDQIGI